MPPIVFWATIELNSVAVPESASRPAPPPEEVAVLYAMVSLIRVSVPVLSMPPPERRAVQGDRRVGHGGLAARVCDRAAARAWPCSTRASSRRTASVPLGSLAIAPPVAAVLPLSVSFMSGQVAEVVDTAPPRLADPPVIVSPVNVAVTPLDREDADRVAAADRERTR